MRTLPVYEKDSSCTRSSSTSSASPSSASSPEVCWATSKDFEAHRAIITRLYIDEAKSLNQVSASMARDYNFRATDRMYKRRFADWNLRKNKKYTKSKPGSQTLAKVPPHNLQWTVGPTQRPPSPSFLLAPECIRLPETVLQYSRLMVLSGSSEKYLLHRPVLGGLHLQMMSVRAATQAIELKEYRLAFDILQRFFDDKVHAYELSNGNISFFVVAMLVMMRLPEDLASRVLEFISRLVTIKLPSSHPIVRAWTTILEADRQSVWDNAFYFVDKYFEVLQSAHGKSDPMLKKLAAVMCDPEMYFDHKRKGSSPSARRDSGIVGTVGTVEEERNVLPTVKRYLGEECALLHHRLVTAYAYLVAGEPSRTREIAAEVSAVCDAHHGTWHYDIINDRSMALQLRAAMREGGGSPAECRRVAAKYTQHTLDFACSMEGIVSPELTDTLQAVFQDDGRQPQSGDDQEAATIRLLGKKKMGPPRPSTTQSAPTTTAAAAVAGDSNDAKQAALAIVFQKLGISGMHTFAAIIQLQLKACKKESACCEIGNSESLRVGSAPGRVAQEVVLSSRPQHGLC
ncbi:hypothetical protein PG985_010543 [Apiospora marii]|uniref:Clr5 domain-containing protein n=1 Tax=Apiospora marii TaxID=335849 RepID=A0ABR1T304_9PEZI